MHIENYNIHNIIKFQLVNKTGYRLLQNLNPEYEYFKTEKEIIPDFRILVTNEFFVNKSLKEIKHLFQKTYDKWQVQVVFYKDGLLELQIIPSLNGVRKVLSYTAIKNIYVRSLIYYYLQKRNRTLVHSCSINVNGKSCLFAGRPGVFKTSILMDFMRKYGAHFLGEENTMLADGLLYPFPLNIKSIVFKINHFANENPVNKIEKLKLGFHLLCPSNKNFRNSLVIQEPKPPQVVCYLSKSDRFEIIECEIDDIIDKLVDNEIRELSIPPTHSLSGIKYNYFKELLDENDPAIITKMRKNLYKIFEEQFAECVCYKIFTPHKYSASLIDSIISEINL